MIITLPIVPANFQKLRLGDEILFRFFKEWNGALIHCSILHQKVKKLETTISNYRFLRTEDPVYNLHEGCFILKENTDFPFADEMGSELNRYQSHIYRYSQRYYAFLFARLKTKDTGYKIAEDFTNRLEVREETESYNKAFLESHGVTDLDSLVAKVDAIRRQ
jgi:hypothetical protein